MTKDRKEYRKAYYQAHKDYYKAYNQANKEQHKAWKEAHREQVKAANKAWYEANREQHKAHMKAYCQAHKEQMKEYKRADVNANGETKDSIRNKSRFILKQMNLHIDGYEIHHCFGYEDPSKFIYISKSLHLNIHQYLRDNNIDASCDHWMAIRDLVNDTDEFTYIKC